MGTRRLLAILAISALVAACAGPASTGEPQAESEPRAESQTRTDEGGGVTVSAEWPVAAGEGILQVQLDTHSVDLDGLDLADALLRNDRGQILAARPWQAPPGGHHRAGALSFEGDAAAFFAGATWFELVVSGVGEVAERALRFEVSR
jgi:hypothetical protein